MSSKQKWRVEAFAKNGDEEVDHIFINPGPEMRSWINYMWQSYGHVGGLYLRVRHNPSGTCLSAKIDKQVRTFVAELPHATLPLPQAMADMKRMLSAKKDA